MSASLLPIPARLLALAQRDDPPTVIEDELLLRLHRAGVEQLVPATGKTKLEDDDAERATAIGALLPGGAFAESLENEQAPVHHALIRLRDFLEGFDRLRRLRLAAIDMRLAESAATRLAGPDADDRILETGLVITYARTYLDSNKTGGVAGTKGNWNPTCEKELALHERLIEELRHPYHAHATRTAYRTLADTTAMLGLDDAPIYAEAWTKLTVDDLKAIAELARRQAERFDAAANQLALELGERRPAADAWLVDADGKPPSHHP